LTLQEFDALRHRQMLGNEFLEYCGALSPWATFNVNRGKGMPFRQVEEFQLRQRARLMLARPAAGAAPAPQQMRFARPGERPPSRFAPGNHPDLISRLDASASRRGIWRNHGG
jgi:hypothetical protein